MKILAAILAVQLWFGTGLALKILADESYEARCGRGRSGTWIAIPLAPALLTGAILLRVAGYRATVECRSA